MSAAKPTIRVIGAAGRTGGLVTAALARRGATVRALLRDASSAGTARANGATEIAIGADHHTTSNPDLGGLALAAMGLLNSASLSPHAGTQAATASAAAA
jgi:uncharacterized protein YbjT (DUF2867 family)